MKKGPVELGANEKEGESESKVTNQIFGRLQHLTREVRYLENIAHLSCPWGSRIKLLPYTNFYLEVYATK